MYFYEKWGGNRVPSPNKIETVIRGWKASAY
jgi:hypothetical protein